MSGTVDAVGSRMRSAFDAAERLLRDIERANALPGHTDIYNPVDNIIQPSSAPFGLAAQPYNSPAHSRLSRDNHAHTGTGGSRSYSTFVSSSSSRDVFVIAVIPGSR